LNKKRLIKPKQELTRGWFGNMNKKQLEKIIALKLETFTLNKNTKEMWLLPYTNGEYEPSCDIVENEQDLLRELNEIEKCGFDYRIIKLVKGE